MTEELATYGGPEGESPATGQTRRRIGEPIRYAGTGVQTFVVIAQAPGVPDLFEVWIETTDEVPTVQRRHWQSQSELAVKASARLLAANLAEVSQKLGLQGSALIEHNGRLADSPPERMFRSALEDWFEGEAVLGDDEDRRTEGGINP